jgi:hypothetical protein
MNIAGSLFALSQFENIKKEERRQELEEFYDNLGDIKEEKSAKKKNTNCIGEKQNEIRKKVRKVEKSVE